MTGSCSVSSGGVRVLVDQAAQDGFSPDLLCIDVGHASSGSVAFVGDVLRDAVVRPGGVVMRLVLGQDGAQVLPAEDQHAVQELAAQGAAQALADRVHPWRLDRCAQDPGAGGLKKASNEAVKFDPRSRMGNLMSSDRSPRVKARLRACCTVHSPVGLASIVQGS